MKENFTIVFPILIKKKKKKTEAKYITIEYLFIILYFSVEIMKIST